MGVAVGIGFADIFPPLVKYFRDSPVRTSTASWSVITSFVISGLIGIFFGLYPAIMAARMSLIEAMGRE